MLGGAQVLCNFVIICSATAYRGLLHVYSRPPPVPAAFVAGSPELAMFGASRIRSIDQQHEPADGISLLPRRTHEII